MANPSRTIRVRFDGDAKGLTRAVQDGVKGIRKFSDDVRKSSGGFMSGIVDSIKSAAGQVNGALSSVFQGGLRGALSTPVVGPIILAALASIAATIAPAAATLIGGALVLGIGAGLAGVGALVLAQSEKIQNQFSATFENIKKTLTDAFEPLIPVLDVVREVMAGVVDQLAPFIKQGMELAQGPLKGFVQQLGVAFQQLGPAIEPLMKAFGDLLTELGPYLVPLFKSIADELITLAGKVSENKEEFAAMVSFVLGLAPFLLQVINFLIDAFRGIVDGAKAAWDGVSAAFDSIWSVVSSVMDAIKTTIGAVLKVIGALFNGNLDDVKRAVREGLDAIRSAWSSAWDSIKSFFKGIWTTIKDALSSAVSSLWEGISSLGSRVIKFMRSLPGKILNALGNVGGLLYEAGSNIIQGLIDGISSMVGKVKDKISSVVQTIRDYLPFSPAKVGPLSGSGNPEASGRKIGQMLADGLNSSIKTVRTAMGDLLSGGVPAPAMAVASPSYEVRVFIGDQELRGLIRSEVSETNRQIRRRALAV